MYFVPSENLPKSVAEQKWCERIAALGCSVEQIPKPFWYKQVKVYIFPNRAPGVEHKPNQWHAEFWASSTPTVTACCESFRDCKKLAKKLINEAKKKDRWIYE